MYALPVPAAGAYCPAAGPLLRSVQSWWSSLPQLSCSLLVGPFVGGARCKAFTQALAPKLVVATSASVFAVGRQALGPWPFVLRPGPAPLETHFRSHHPPRNSA